MKPPGRYRKKFLAGISIIIFIIFNQAGVYAQSQEETLAGMVQLAKHAYGTNDKLVNGVVYLPKHPRAHGGPYYPANNYTEGNIYINGTGFNACQIKYNAAIQKLILKSSISESAVAEILLNNTRVDSFQLDESKFIHARHAGIPALTNGYFEIIHRGDFRFMAYRKIVFQDVYSRKYPFGRYAMLPSTYFFIQNDSITTINNKRDLYSLFPAERNNIKKYIQKHKIKFKKASGEELKALINFSEKKQE